MNDTIKSIIDIIKSCEDVQLCTNRSDGYPETRLITNGLNHNIEILDLHFLTMKTSQKFQQLLADNRCSLYYFNPDTHYSVRLFGRIKKIDDKSEKEKYWQDKFSRFGLKGSNDPNFALIKFIPEKYKFYIGEKLCIGKIE